MVGKSEAVVRPGKTERLEAVARLKIAGTVQTVERPGKIGKLEAVE
jgi:hypothetical protein